MLSYRTLVAALFLLLATVSGDKTTEEPISIAKFFENLNTKFQEATHKVEEVMGVDIPSTKQEVEAVLQQNINLAKESTKKIQSKLAEHNVTSESFSGMLQNVQNQINATVEDLGHRNPDVGKLLEQFKQGYANLTDVSQKIQKTVEEQAGSATEDLKVLAQQARTEVSKFVSHFEKQIQEFIAEKDKKTAKA